MSGFTEKTKQNQSSFRQNFKQNIESTPLGYRGVQRAIIFFAVMMGLLVAGHWCWAVLMLVAYCWLEGQIKRARGN